MPVKPNRRNRNSEGKLPLIQCSRCGTEIMLVPNVKLMSDAIEAHVESHKSKMKKSPDAEAEAELIRGDLIRQVLDKASRQGELASDEE